MTDRVDAIVVGLGAAGAIVAEQLAAAGLEVVGLEKGPHFTAHDFRFKHDELRYFTRQALSPHMGTDPLTWRPSEREQATVLPWGVGAQAIGPLFLPPSSGSGGGTVHWAAWCWRFRPAEFRMRSAIVERFGESALPEDSTLVDWPIGYDDLEPYYDRVEWEQGVSGQAGNLNGELQPGGNPFEAPRRRGYPMPPLRQGAASERFAEACRRLGYHPFPAPAGIASHDYDGRSACVYCGFCRDYPCHVDAKTSTQLTSIPRALASGNFEIRPYARVFRVNRDRSGRATGVAYFDADGTERELGAETVVLACYALENARLLLVSGVNENGQVGRHFMTHNYGWFTGTLPEWTNPFMGPAVACNVIDDITSELVPDNQEGVLWGSPIIGFAGDVQPLEMTLNMPEDAPTWGRGFKDWLRENYRRTFSMYSQTPTFPSSRFHCDLDPAVTDRFGQPALRITHGWVEHDVKAVELIQRVKRAIADEMGMRTFWEAPLEPPYHLSTHEVGTHRMGEDPSASVVDPFGQCHECPGLYAVGGGQFPSYGSYNPTETIMALAYWAADHVLENVGAPPSVATAEGG
jgi:gluconate 2-dehydrogenase alpha chain